MGEDISHSFLDLKASGDAGVQYRARPEVSAARIARDISIVA
jgi:hypothetical protein